MKYIDRFMRGGCADKSQPPATQRSEMYPVNPMDWFRCIPSRVWDPRRRCSDGFGFPLDPRYDIVVLLLGIGVDGEVVH